MAFENGMNMTPADIKAVIGDDGFGNGNGLWWIIILFLLCGWGRGGYGNGGDSVRDYLQTDVATLERKMDSITNGLCDGFYTNAQLINGVNMNLANGFSTAELARSNGQTQVIQEINGVSRQLADCCCQNRYDSLVNANNTQKAVTEGFCQTNFNNQIATRDIIDSGKANTDAILEELRRQAIEQKDAKIQEQAQMINALQLSASQSRQNEYIIGRLQPNPQPAYVVPNPYGCNCNTCGC